MVYTASFAFFEAIWEAGITHCFVNLGSDHPSIIEAMVKGQNEKRDRFPRIITCPNEMVALSMADGFARLTSRPQCVIVHVDVGTQGLGAAVHNASTGRAPVLIFAGLSPYTLDGELRGSRTEYIHWIQDVPDQKQIVAQYCRFTGEVKTGRNVKQIVNRALSFATSDPRGPVYVYGAREAMEEELQPYALDQALWTPVAPTALPPQGVELLARELAGAKEPLVIVGYSGRDHQAVRELVKLADLVPGLRVLDTGGSDMCFPADHPAYLGLRYGVSDCIPTADIILIAACDVPWIPTRCRPARTARIYHLDVDPLKQQMPVFYVDARARYRADAALAFAQIAERIKGDKEIGGLMLQGNEAERKREELRDAHKERIAGYDKLALAPAPSTDSTAAADDTFDTSYLCALLRKLCPSNTTWVVEAVTQTQLVADQIRPSRPGSWFNCGGGGLGWSGGAALGIRLALEEEELARKRGSCPDTTDTNTDTDTDTTETETEIEPPFVTQIVGDGTYLFSIPSSVYWISARYALPHLTVVLNNNGWHAPQNSLLLVHPEGEASRATREDMNIAFRPTPDYAGVAAAAAGAGGVVGVRCGRRSGLEAVLREAVETVRGGKGVVLDAHLGGSEGKVGGE